METTEYTLQKGFVKNDLHLLLCEDTVWKNWVSIMDTYARGGLPNTKGDLLASSTTAEQWLPKLKDGKIQQAPGTVMLGPTIFRCIAGLEVSEVLSLQEALLNKVIILKKGKHTKNWTDMEELAWSMKVERVLKVAIIDFYHDLSKEKLDWNQTCEQYKIGDHEYNQLKSYSEAFVKDSLNRTKRTPSLPQTVVTLLHHLYRASQGQPMAESSIPWTIKGVGLDMEKLGSFCRQNHLPFRLAIMDARGLHSELSNDSISTMISHLNAMNSLLEYVLVCFADFISIGAIVEGVSTQAGKVHYEVGVVIKDDEHTFTRGQYAYASIIMFISKGNAFESIHKAAGDKVLISTNANANDNTIDKDFLMRLIESFCPQQNYVVDIFSGGYVLQQSLISKRRCIAFCKNDVEAMNLESKCSEMLESIPHLQEWCGQILSTLKPAIELNEDQMNALDEIEVDKQASGDDRSEDEDGSGSDEEVVIQLRSSDASNKGRVTIDCEKADIGGSQHVGANDEDQGDKEKSNGKEQDSHHQEVSEQKDGGTDNMPKDNDDKEDNNKQLGRIEF